VSRVKDIHPVAALFPLLPDDELEELADDIRRNGLLHPIVLDADGVLIDGRNRLAACERARVEPTFTTLRGVDPVAYILAANVTRRHLSKGQRAMAMAKARLLSNQTQRQAAAEAGVSQSLFAQADAVVQHAPDLVDAVLAGARLYDAYEEALRRKRVPEEQAARRVAFERDEERRARDEERLRASIELAVEEIGPDRPLPPADRWPSLEVGIVEAAPPPSGKPAEGAALRAQQAYLKRLIGVRNAVSALRAEPVVGAGWWPEGHAAAVRSAVSQIVTDALAIAEANNAQADQKLRKVK